MGSGISFSMAYGAVNGKISPRTCQWKDLNDLFTARERYLQERVLPADVSTEEVELQVLLEDVVAKQCICASVNTLRGRLLLECIEDCKSLQNEGKIASMIIYRKYTTTVNKWLESCKGVKDCQFKRVNLRFLYHACFKSLYVDVFLPFKYNTLGEYTNEYVMMRRQLYDINNYQVGVNDFIYHEQLGMGAYGLVVKCRLVRDRSASPKLYAMKIQSKSRMLRQRKTTDEVSSRALVELRSYAYFNQTKHYNPFICDLVCAFQTHSLLFMVMPLAENGDLSTSLKAYPCGRMDIQMVKFYAAELVSAIGYLHSHGFIHRDIKPQNVLVKADGHILLTDFGLMAG